MLPRYILMLAFVPYLMGATPVPMPDSAIAAVDEFHRALEQNDPARALALLAQGLVVCEFGVIDPNKDAYAFAHLPIDLQLASRTRWTLESRKVGGVGEQRWIVSGYRVVGTGPDNKSIDETVLETAITQHVGTYYSIAHIHWSSTPRVAPPT